MGKRRTIILLSMLLLLLLSGCMSEGQYPISEDTLTPVDQSLIVVGVSQIGSESVWRTANSASIQNEFTKKNGYFLIFDNARQKQENQIKAIRSFISQQVDYIVFSPITETGWETVLQEAKDANIPVILMDRQVKVQDTSLYTTWIGSDFKAEGENAGLWLEKYLEEQGRGKDKINIVVLQGTPGSTSVIGRTDGFNSIVKKHDNWNVLEEVDAEYTTAKGYEVMENLLKKYKDIDVVVSQNDDMTFGAVEAMQKAGISTGVDGDITIISFDAVKTALDMVEKGIINVDIECNPEQGPYIENVIQMLERGEEVEKAYFISEKIFTKENVSAYLKDRTY